MKLDLGLGEARQLAAGARVELRRLGGQRQRVEVPVRVAAHHGGRGALDERALGEHPVVGEPLGLRQAEALVLERVGQLVREDELGQLGPGRHRVADQEQLVPARVVVRGRERCDVARDLAEALIRLEQAEQPQLGLADRELALHARLGELALGQPPQARDVADLRLGHPLELEVRGSPRPGARRAACSRPRARAARSRVEVVPPGCRRVRAPGPGLVLAVSASANSAATVAASSANVPISPCRASCTRRSKQAACRAGPPSTFIDVPDFKLNPAYTPTADQPRAIDSLAEGLAADERYLTLLGATGTGKTFTMAATIERIQRPALVIAHNKTLAAQLCNEFREFFPDNAVEYFVSYYDYYQPEAYVPAQDLYIEKDSSINDEIDRLRHAATAALLARRDVVIVASVSCIYGIGSPELYARMMQLFKVGDTVDRDELFWKLVNMQYNRNDTVLSRGTFRAKGEVLEVWNAYMESAYRVNLFGDEIESIQHFDPLTGEIFDELDHVAVWPASHYVTEKETMERGIQEIKEELAERVAWFEERGKLLEAHRLQQRTEYDLEMLRELGFASGIENYSRIFDGRAPGSPPHTLMDYFPDDFVCFVDESHQTIPQIGGMYEGDHSRKKTLIEHGFRLPSAFDNRPLKFGEYLDRINQLVMVSATPGEFERSEASRIAEQIVRPTGIVDPEVEVRETKNQVDDLMNEVRRRAEVTASAPW